MRKEKTTPEIFVMEDWSAALARPAGAIAIAALKRDYGVFPTFEAINRNDNPDNVNYFTQPDEQSEASANSLADSQEL